MTSNEISVGNVKIGKFMGYALQLDDKNHCKGEYLKNGRRKSILSYHTDWSDLMGVVEYIENLDLSNEHYQWQHDGETRYNFEGISVTIDRCTCCIGIELALDGFDRINNVTGTMQHPSKIEAVFLSVVEFIDWYENRYYATQPIEI